MELKLIAVVGPTASGKTNRAVAIARHIDAEIISGDSRQVYRGMDLGTGKDLCEYGEIPYHLIDIRDAGYKYNLHEYIKDFHDAYTDIRFRNKNVVLCGGSGMYVESVLSGVRLPDVPVNQELRSKLEGKSLDELHTMLSTMKHLHNSTDVDTVKRAIRAIEICEYYNSNPDAAELSDRTKAEKLQATIIGIEIDREKRRERISQRLKSRLNDGMAEEIRDLIKNGVSPEDLKYYGLEYKYITEYVVGERTYSEMFNSLEIAIHQFAKRQMTWFRGMERRGFNIHWLPYDLEKNLFLDEVDKLIKQS